METGKKAHLCEMAADKGMFGELKEAARNARYICPGCHRVAADKERICCRAEEIYGQGKTAESGCCRDRNKEEA